MVVSDVQPHTGLWDTVGNVLGLQRWKPSRAWAAHGDGIGVMLERIHYRLAEIAVSARIGLMNSMVPIEVGLPHCDSPTNCGSPTYYTCLPTFFNILRTLR